MLKGFVASLEQWDIMWSLRRSIYIHGTAWNITVYSYIETCYCKNRDEAIEAVSYTHLDVYKRQRFT